MTPTSCTLHTFLDCYDRRDLIMRAQIIGVSVFSLGCVVSSDGYADGRMAPAWLHEVKIGVLHHDTPDLWSGFRRETGVDVNLEAIFSPQVGVLGGVIRPAFGGSVNTAGDTSKLYTGLRWQYEHVNGLFFGVGLGGAIHNGNLHLQHNDRKALGQGSVSHSHRSRISLRRQKRVIDLL